MRKIFSIALIGGSLLFFGCSKSPSTPECQIDGAKAPSWVCDGGASMKGGIFAVGSAPKSPLGITFQREEAMAHARDEIAREIKLKVKNMIKSYMSSTGMGDSQTAERVVTSVSKQVTSLALQGTKLIKTWTSPNGTMYVLVGVDKNIKNYVKNAVATTFRNDKALWQEFKAKKAQEELERAVDKEFN